MWFRRIFWALLLVVCGVTGAEGKAEDAKEPTQVGLYLPLEKVTGTVLRGLGAEERMKQYMKLQKKNASKGLGALENMQQINELVGFVEDKEVELTFSALESGRVKITTEPETVIHGIIIDKEKAEVTLADGKILTTYNEISISNMPGVGDWKGIRWSTQESEPSQSVYNSANFSIGQITKDNKQKRSMQLESMNMNKLKFDQENFIILY